MVAWHTDSSGLVCPGFWDLRLHSNTMEANGILFLLSLQIYHRKSRFFKSNIVAVQFCKCYFSMLWAPRTKCLLLSLHWLEADLRDWYLKTWASETKTTCMAWILLRWSEKLCYFCNSDTLTPSLFRNGRTSGFAASPRQLRSMKSHKFHNQLLTQ